MQYLSDRRHEHSGQHAILPIASNSNTTRGVNAMACMAIEMGLLSGRTSDVSVFNVNVYRGKHDRNDRIDG